MNDAISSSRVCQPHQRQKGNQPQRQLPKRKQHLPRRHLQQKQPLLLRKLLLLRLPPRLLREEMLPQQKVLLPLRVLPLRPPQQKVRRLHQHQQKRRRLRKVRWGATLPPTQEDIVCAFSPSLRGSLLSILCVEGCDQFVVAPIALVDVHT